jgi:hypothetical protein
LACGPLARAGRSRPRPCGPSRMLVLAENTMETAATSWTTTGRLAKTQPRRSHVSARPPAASPPPRVHHLPHRHPLPTQPPRGAPESSSERELADRVCVYYCIRRRVEGQRHLPAGGGEPVVIGAASGEEDARGLAQLFEAGTGFSELLSSFSKRSWCHEAGVWRGRARSLCHWCKRVVRVRRGILCAFLVQFSFRC